MLFIQRWFSSVIVWRKTPGEAGEGRRGAGGGALEGLQSAGKGAAACVWEAGLQVSDL